MEIHGTVITGTEGKEFVWFPLSLVLGTSSMLYCEFTNIMSGKGLRTLVQLF